MSDIPTPEKSRRRILALLPGGAPADLSDQLADLGQVRIVDSVDAALHGLREQPADFVVVRPVDLFPLARAEARQRGEIILERIGQAVCIVDRHGALLWCNPRLNAYPPLIIETLKQHCAAIAAEFAGERPDEGEIRTRRRTVRVGNEHTFDLTVSDLVTREGDLEEVVGLALDVSAAQRLQERINAIDLAGRELIDLDAEATSELDVAERLAMLEERVVNLAHDLLHFDHFVVRVLDKNTSRLETVIASGLSEEAKSLDIYAAAEGNGITGYVAATGRSYICPDVSRDSRYLPGLEHPGSTLTVPLKLHDHVIGTLDVESHDVAAFSEDDRQFAEMFGRHIAVALHLLKLLAAERSTTTGQIATDVAAELAAPLNDIISESTAALARWHDQPELRDRFRGIIEHVDQAKRGLQAVTQTQGVRGLIPESAAYDPLLEGKRILVADDEDIIRDTIGDVLTKNGALVVTARDGLEAISMVRNQHFDLVISDIKMPHKNGYEVFAATKTALTECPVVLITGFGYDPEHSIVRASREGLAGVLFKPFKVEQLVDEVRRAFQPTG